MLLSLLRLGAAPSGEHIEKLPLVDRVRLLASGGLSFYREGSKVSSVEAMRPGRGGG